MILIERLYKTLLAALVSTATFTVNAYSKTFDQFHFRVLLDNKEIGTHVVELNEIGDEQYVNIKASFDVKLLFVTLYSYRHNNREVWNDNCLIHITAETDDNGKSYFIRSLETNDGLRLYTQDGGVDISGCVRSFAYWDPDLLNTKKLLNTQTGEYTQISLETLGNEVIKLGDWKLDTKRYRLNLQDSAIDLWYTLGDRWIALESQTRSGKTIRYEAIEVSNNARADI